MKRFLTALALLLLASTAMAVLRDTLVQNVTLTPAGSPYSYQANVQNNVTVVKLGFARKNWPNLGEGVPVIKAQIEVSLDNGQTWQRLVAGAAPGGAILNPLGVEITEFQVQANLPDGNARKVRLTGEVFAELLTDIAVLTE